MRVEVDYFLINYSQLFDLEILKMRTVHNLNDNNNNYNIMK